MVQESLDSQVMITTLAFNPVTIADTFSEAPDDKIAPYGKSYRVFTIS
jgi:hypothetical protein